jgi:anti-sigma factor RsiW
LDVTPHTDELLERCTGYVLGNLSDTELGALEAHLKEGCPACEAEIHRLGRGAWAFAAATPRLLEPSPMRTRILDGVLRESREREGQKKEGRRAPIPFPRRRSTPVFGWFAFLAAVVFAVSGVIEWRAASRMQRELSVAREEVTRLNEEIQSERQWTAMATAPQTRVIQLVPTPAGLAGAEGAQLRARVAYDPATRQAIVSASGLAAPPGKDYQLWAITNTGPVSLGLLRADRDGKTTIRLPNAGDPFTLSAFAISLENEGGAPTPTAPAGPVVMAGKVGT